MYVGLASVFVAVVVVVFIFVLVNLDCVSVLKFSSKKLANIHSCLPHV